MIFGVCNRMLRASKRGLTTCCFMMLVEYIIACLLARYAVRAANLPSTTIPLTDGKLTPRELSPIGLCMPI